LLRLCERKPTGPSIWCLLWTISESAGGVGATTAFAEGAQLTKARSPALLQLVPTRRGLSVVKTLVPDAQRPQATTSNTNAAAATTTTAASPRLPVRMRARGGSSHTRLREKGAHSLIPPGVQPSAATWAA
jgi:hypothetical protein